MSTFRLDTISHAVYHCHLLRVVVGEHDVSDSSDGQQSFTASSWTSHPSHDSDTVDYDFALLTLTSPLTFSSSVMPACLPDSSTDYDAVTAVVSGWGTTSSGGSQPSVLMEAEVTTRYTVVLYLDNTPEYYC